MLKQDFRVNSNGDIMLTDDNIEMLTGRDIYVQAFRLILSTRQTEYFLNLNEGLRFDVFLGQKELDEELAMEALQEASIQVEDFVKFINIEYDYNRITRVLYITFDALFEDGFRLSLDQEVNI